MSIDVIFLGLDGVLFDTEALHLAACNAALDQAQSTAGAEMSKLTGGFNNEPFKLSYDRTLNSSSAAGRHSLPFNVITASTSSGSSLNFLKCFWNSLTASSRASRSCWWTMPPPTAASPIWPPSTRPSA